MKTQFNSSHVKKTVIASALILAASSASAQAQMTPQQFMSACANNPSNTVVLTQQTKFQTNFTNTQFQTPTGCRVVLSPGAAFELDTITLVFGGPLVVEGASEGKIALAKAKVSAASVQFNLLGEKSQLEVNESQVSALTGSLGIAFGALGKMEMKNSGGFTSGGFSARSEFRLSAGAFFSAAVVDSGIVGATGMAISLDGVDSSLKVENSALHTSSTVLLGAEPTFGPFSLTGSADKASVELINTSLRFASQSINMRLNGAESKLLLKNTTSLTGTANGVYLGAGRKGTVIVESPIFYGISGVVIETGAEGVTGVIGSPGVVNSAVSIRVASGPSGACHVFPASMFDAPVEQLCQ